MPRFNTLDIKYKLLNFAANPFLKALIYIFTFLIILRTAYLWEFSTSLESIGLELIIAFLLLIIPIEWFIEFFLSSQLNQKQTSNLRKFFGFWLLPTLIPAAVFNSSIFLIIPATFAITVALLGYARNFFSNSRRIEFISLIGFLFISFTSNLNLNYTLISLIILATLTIIPIRLVENLPSFYVDFDDETKNILKNNKNTKELISRYIRVFDTKATTAFAIDDKIYFLYDSKVFDEYKNEIIDNNIKEIINNLSDSKLKITDIIGKFKAELKTQQGIIYSNRVLYYFSLVFSSLFFNPRKLDYINRFMLENYDSLKFPGKGELDKELTKSDTELSVIRDDIEEFLFKLFYISKEFLDLPSNVTLNKVKEYYLCLSNKIKENQIEVKIDKREKIAEDAYKNKYVRSFHTLKKSINDIINIVRDYEFLNTI